MSIAARCGDCQKLFKVDEKFAGKKVRCKACGGVIAVPAQAARIPDSTPRKPVAQATTVSDDPFGNLDDLMSLEAGGVVDESAPPPPLRTRPQRHVREDRDDILAPPANSPTRLASAPLAPAYAARSTNAYVTTPMDDTIDSWVPLGTIGVFLLFLVITFIRAMSNAASANAPMWAVFQGLLIISGTVTAFVLAILTPLCLLGVFIASKIMKFETPGSFFWRCAAVVCAPISLYILLSGFGFAEPKAVSWVFGLATMLGVLWLMFRLKPLHYLVNASFVLVIMVGLPVLLFVFVLAGLGLTFGGMGVSAAKHRAMQVHSAANLKQISLALMVYANEHKGQFPPTLDILPRTTNLDPQALRTPDGEGYDYNFFPGINNGMTESYMVVNESVADEKGAVNGLFLDGHVELLSASQWEAAQLNNGRVRANRVNRGNTAAGSSSTSPPQPIENAGHAKTVVIPRTSRVAPTDPAQYHAAVEASLRRVADALDKYANAHGGKYPLNIMSLASSGLIQNSDMMSPRGIMYGLEAGNLKPPLPANVIIIYETGSTDGKRTVVWGDKRIETVDQTAFVAALKESRKSRSSLPR